MRGIGLLLAWVAVAIAPCAANALGFQFTGTIETVWVSPSFTGTVPTTATVGQTGSGTGSFDELAPGVSTGPGRTEFAQSGHSISLSIPGLDVQLPIVLANTSVEALATRFGLTALLEGADAQALGVDRVDLLFGLVGGPGLLPVGVLPTVLSETVWDQRQQVLLRGWTQIGVSTFGESWLVALEPVAIVIPEPATAMLLGLALAGLGLRARAGSGIRGTID